MDAAIEIYDTTLRDGTQGMQVAFSVTDKLRIAKRLDDFGVEFVEAGWPGSNPKDIEFFEAVQGCTFKRARLAAFGSTRRKQLRAADDGQLQLLINARTEVVTIFGKTSLLHVRHVLKTTPEENLAMIVDTIRLLKACGKIVVYDAEHGFDAFKEDRAYALATLQAAEAAGADVVTLCDTNGGSLPMEISDVTKVVRARLTVRLGIHSHDDLGLGVANALAAVEAGATQVQGTINGYGERTGNCNLTSVIPNLQLKMKKACVPSKSMAQLTELSRFVDNTAHLRRNQRLPWVGAAAFSHKGGTHVNAIQKITCSYEHCDPAAVGNTRRVLVSDLSGSSNLILKARELGFDVARTGSSVRAILRQIKDLEHQGYECEEADGSLVLLIRRRVIRQRAPFTVDGYDVSIRSDGRKSVCDASVTVRVAGRAARGIAEGADPIHAITAALRSVLSEAHPELACVRLSGYTMRVVDLAAGATTTRVLVKMTHGQSEWGTVGVHENVIVATLQAVMDGYEYIILRRMSCAS
jgi:2-isopropylmalate synthase